LGRAKTVQQVMDSAFARKRWPDRNERREKVVALVDSGLTDEAEHYGFLIDLSSLNFDDPKNDERWYHAVPIGQYDHPLYDKDMTNFTPEKIEGYARSVTERYTGIDPDIDYEHKDGSEGGKAAGWVKAAEARLDLENEDERGLYVQIEWTPRAIEALKNKEYKYFSPELATEWRHPKNGTIFKDVFFGGALTNRPFLKDLAPLNFSEAVDAWETTQEPQKDKEVEGGDVKLADVLKLFDLKLSDVRSALGLSDDASEDDIVAAAKKRLLASAPEIKTDEPTISKKFEEDYPEIAEQMRKDREEAASLSAQLHEERIEGKLSNWFDGNFKFSTKEKKDGEETEVTQTIKRALPPVAKASVKEFCQVLSADQAEKFDALIGSILRAGIVELSQKGSSQLPDNIDRDDENAGKEFTALIQKKQKEFADANPGKTLPFREAVVEASKEDPDLAKAWRDANRKTA
jgi:Mu-like prophage I protein